MTVSNRLMRPLIWLSLAVVLVSATSGCSWLRKKTNYQASKQTNPLEIPPGLDTPNTSDALLVPSVTGGSAAVSTATGATAAVASLENFTVNDSQESTWKRMGLALNRIDGVTVTSSAQSLSSYDIRYDGVNYLIRAENAGDNQTRVTAFSPSGPVAANSPGARLLGILKSRLN